MTAAGELRVFHGGQAGMSPAQLWGPDQAVPDLTPTAERERPRSKAGRRERGGERGLSLRFPPFASASTPHFSDLYFLFAVTGSPLGLPGEKPAQKCASWEGAQGTG